MKSENEMNDIEYLEYSLEVVQKAHDDAVEQLRRYTEDIRQLQVDMKKITNPNLQNACKTVHNKVAIEKRTCQDTIKQALVDLKHIRSILKIVRGAK